MADLKIYRIESSAQDSLIDLEDARRDTLQQLADLRLSPTPTSLLEFERRVQAVQRRLADIHTAAALFHLSRQPDIHKRARDQLFHTLSADKSFQELKGLGRKEVTVVFLGGLSVAFELPAYTVKRSRRGATKKTPGRSKGNERVFPLLTMLGVSSGVTPALRFTATREMVVAASYREAHEQLQERGIGLGIKRLVRVAEETAARSLDQRRAWLEEGFTLAPPKRTFLAGLRLQLSLDGGRVRTRESLRAPGVRGGRHRRRPILFDWCEPRLAILQVLDEAGKPDRRFRAIPLTLIRSADECFAELGALLRRFGVREAKELVIVADGAPWIWNRLPELLTYAELDRDKVTEVLDYYHATERITEVLRACRGLRPDDAEKLGKSLRCALLAQGGTKIVLAELRERTRGRGNSKARELLQYLELHEEHMSYGLWRSEGKPIGSGLVESGIRRVVNMRFKSGGQQWKKERVERLLELRAISKYGWWTEFEICWLEDRCWLAGAVDSALARRKDSKRAA